MKTVIYFSNTYCTKQSYPGLKSSLVDWIPGNRLQLVLLTVISVKCQCHWENFCRIWKSESSINNRVVSFCTLIDWVVAGSDGCPQMEQWFGDTRVLSWGPAGTSEQILWHLLLLRLDCTKRLRDNIINGNASSREGWEMVLLSHCLHSLLGNSGKKGEDIFHVPLTICIISIAAWDTVL